MAILAGDIKLAKSQVMDDVPEGGGAPTANIVVDGTSNAIFNDISELDRAGGRVNLRKVFVSVQTPDTDGYFGSNVIVADAPDDPNVHVAVFSTGETFDTRADATTRVEAYLNAGPLWPGLLYENHIAGQRSIQIFQRTNQDPPSVGRTIVLRQDEGLPTQIEQYVRITRVESETRTFTDTQGDYLAQVITCDLSDALRDDFSGTPANRYFTVGAGKAIVRDTVVADAGSYYGVSPLTAAASIGDVSVEAESIYTRLVPNSQTETAVLDQKPSGDAELVLAEIPFEVVYPVATKSQRIRIGQENRGFNYVSILKPLPSPGTVKVVYRALGRTYTITDNGDGTMSGSGAGVVNYMTGSIQVTLEALPDDRSGLMIYWGEALSFTDRTGQVGFRLPEFGFQLAKTGIKPGTLTIEWTSGAVVETATDDGSGAIIGDATGEIFYAPGELYFKPVAGAFPDPGAEFDVDYQWSAQVVESKPGLTPDGAGVVLVTTDQEPIPGTVEVQWLTTRTASTTSGSSMSGGASNKSTSTLAGTTTTKTLWDGAGDPGDPGYWTTELQTDTHTRTTITENDSSSYSRQVTAASKQSITVSHKARDNGVGPVGGFAAALGSINYVGKSFSIKVVADYEESSYSSNFEDAQSFEAFNETSESATGYAAKPPINGSEGGGGSTSAKGGDYGTEAVVDVYSAASMVVVYQVAPLAPAAHNQTFAGPAVTIDLTPYTSDAIVPGSIGFSWMGQTYRDFEGVIYRGRTDVVPGVASGFVDYIRGQVIMTDYVVGANPADLAVTSLWSRRTPPKVANVVFTTQLSPLKPAGLVVSVVDVTGAQIVATGNVGGEITGDHAWGKVDYETGQCEINFGDYVLDAGLTAEQKLEWWYDPIDVRLDGKIWRPWPVLPETLRYNFVAYAYLPLDANILGLDPVRLPQDGRVPIFRPGAFAVVGHTGTILPGVLAATDVVNCGRVRLSRVRIIGDDGLVINSGYSVDLETGLITIDDVTGWSQPVTIEHRVEDMAMVSEAEIGGRVTFTRQITHDYPSPGSYVSSALVAGDMRARVSVTFDQGTWNNVWEDSVSGSAATGTYNTVLAPIEVTNIGAVTERWAIRFTSTNTFEVIGEHVGVIVTGNTSGDIAPVNPATSQPYFTLRALGWGLGWATGNVLRFNTVGALFPVWVVRTIQQGPETVLDDAFTLLIRGDVDRP